MRVRRGLDPRISLNMIPFIIQINVVLNICIYYSFNLNYEDPVRSAQQTHFVPVIKTNHLILYEETIAVFPILIHKTRDINILCGNNVEILNVKRGGMKINH